MVQAQAPQRRPAARSRPVPRLRGSPVLGSALALRRDFLGTLLQAHREGGDVVRVDAGPPGWRTSLHAVFSPEGVERVLAEPDRMVKQTAAYRELRGAIGDGLLTSEGDAWLRQRRLVAPVFTRRRVAGYAGTVVEEAAGVVARWAAPAARGEAVEVHGEMVRFTARVIGRVLFGADVEAAVPRLLRIAPSFDTAFRRRSTNRHPLPRRVPTPNNRRLAAAVAEMRDIVEGIVSARRTAAARPGAGDRRTDDLLGLLLAAREPGDGGAAALNDAEIADQVLVFLLAGHETTATALACGLVEVARHPQWQEVLHAEVDAVLRGRLAAAADLPRLVWTDRLVREVLRLYPSAHTVGRYAPAGDVVLGHHLPPGATVVVSPWVTHRSPALWPDPERFDPERFAAPRPGGHRYAWFPFGAGPRACIGAQLALTEATLGLATLLQAYRLDTEVTSIPLAAGITLRPSGPLPVRPTARQPQLVPHPR